MAALGTAHPTTTEHRGQQPERKHVVVVGAGIAGLAAAHAVTRDGGDNVSVTVLESDAQVGGKLAVGTIADVPIDLGAESMQATRPEAVSLARAVGMDTELVHPAMRGGAVFARRAVRPMPPTVMGVPTDLRALTSSGVLPMSAVAAMPLEAAKPPTVFEEDVSVGAFVEERLGRAVVETLVEPLLGGVYAGRADALSLRATVPTLFHEVRREGSLLRAARRVSRGGGRESGARRGPVFAGIRGGLGRLPAAVQTDLIDNGAVLRTGATARSLHRTDGGWRVVLDVHGTQEALSADALVLAVPATATAQLLGYLAPGVTSDLRLVKYAGMAVINLAYRSADLPGDLRGTGFLVPPQEGRLVKGVNYTSNKWEWVNVMARSRARDGMSIMRVTMGRYGEEDVLERDDEDLVARASDDISAMTGLRARPVIGQISRWPEGLPQYSVGHVARVQRIRDRIADVPGLELCGAVYDGVGVAATIGSGRAAGAAVLRYLSDRAQSKA